MMYAYSVSAKRSIVVAVVALAVVMSGQRAQAQPGWVLSHQKISDSEGGFTGTPDNHGPPVLWATNGTEAALRDLQSTNVQVTTTRPQGP